MESNTQKLIHSFGALADLGQEVADTGDFMEMVRTSLHLLLGTLAIRRGAIIECPKHNGRFNYQTGEAKGAPVCVDLRTYKVKVEGGKVFVAID